MTTKYQLIKIGEDNSFYSEILETLYRHIIELGLLKECIIEIDENNFATEYKANAPTFCLYFGSTSGYFANQDILAKLLTDATLILPVVTDLTKFTQQIPSELININGFQLATRNDIERLVSSILEGLSLLRLSRRLFISYKRDESSSVAIQLFEQFEKSGFDVFLDTHSIRPGEPFQEELWHRMADTDVVIMLNTPNFMKSHWTTQELAQANAMSIGVVQLVFPNHKLEREAELSIPIQLTYKDFENCVLGTSTKNLTANSIQRIVSQVESIRARSLGARQDNIISEFISFAHKLNVKVQLQPEKFITVAKKDGKELIVIPTVGIPQAFTYHQKEELIKRVKQNDKEEIYILYDQLNIRENWLKHLDWLDNYLPIKTIKILNSEQWLKKI
ncbi:MAG: toll/interleukin-1 receptor domain-containing protein [Chitinophagales bacterium]|nr:toll/interleukin-1 receptor domain-containing protein [Chitinophagales bacterium]